MSNARGKSIDGTQLSVEQAEKRGFIHRDYLAHCLRWTHVIKYLMQGKTYDSARILDIGCGQEVPLAKTMYSSRMNPKDGGVYVGVDYNALTYPDFFHTGKFPLTLVQKCIFPDQLTNEVLTKNELPLEYDVIVCFEVCEHVEPEQTMKMLLGIHDRLAQGGRAFLSTPCYDAHVGAAANHVNEMSYVAFGSMIEEAGLDIRAKWGTFGSMKDYYPYMSKEHKQVFDEMREYYDVNYLATIFAPFYPALSRNCLWEVSRCDINTNPDGSMKRIGSTIFPSLYGLGDPAHSSSEKWPEFIAKISA